jgi:hypothetical protein
MKLPRSRADSSEVFGALRTICLRSIPGTAWDPGITTLFDLMQQIPFNEKGNIYDLALSRPIDFGIFPDDDRAQFYYE